MTDPTTHTGGSSDYRYDLVDGNGGQWLVLALNHCTCSPYYGAHEAGCGYDPVARISELVPPQGAEMRTEWAMRDEDGALVPLASNQSIASWRRRGFPIMQRTVTTTAWTDEAS